MADLGRRSFVVAAVWSRARGRLRRVRFLRLLKGLSAFSQRVGTLDLNPHAYRFEVQKPSCESGQNLMSKRVSQSFCMRTSCTKMSSSQGELRLAMPSCRVDRHLRVVSRTPKVVGYPWSASKQVDQ